MNARQLFLPVFALMISSALAAGPVHHVVIFKFKEDADKEAIQKVEVEFAKLKEKIPGITKLEWGTNSSPEKLNKGFTHIWIVTFKDEAARDAYLPHPEHKAFVEILKPVLEEPMVIDFIPKS
jgi:quinol monooxygenase YgiN